MPTYYISPTGDDTRTSTQAQDIATPWKTLGYALTGSRVPVGSTIVLLDGFFNEHYGANTTIACVLSAGSGVTIVTSRTPLGASLNIPAATVGQFLTGPDSSTLLFYKVNLTNTNNKNLPFVAINGRRDIEVDRCVVDYNNGTYYPFRFTDSTSDEKFSLRRTVLKNVASQAVIRNDKAGGGAPTCIVESNVCHDSARLVDASQKINLTMRNNTSYKLGSYDVSFGAAGNIVKIKNNLMVPRPNTGGFLPKVCAIYFSDITANDVLANPANYDITNNVWHNSATTLAEYEGIVKTNDTVNAVIPLDKTNRYIEPVFTDATNKDFSLSSSTTCYISGRGDASELPVTDINGDAWTGADIGAIKNPYAEITNPTPNTNLVSFCGDSIMNGAWGNCWEKFTQNTGIPCVDNDQAAIGGMRIEGIRWIVDHVVFKFFPHVIFLAGGINNLHLGSHDITNSELAHEIITIMRRVKDCAITPMWLGIESLKNGEDQTRPGLVNNMVDQECRSDGFAYDSIFNRFKLNKNWKLPQSEGGYYEDLDNDLHPNDDGHMVIARIAERLYYNIPYMISHQADYIGPHRNNITRLSGTSTTISPTDTYRLADTKAARDAVGFVYGVDHWAFTPTGIPKEIPGSVLIANGGGDQFFCGSKRIAGYSTVQVEPALTKIKRLTRV